jgi:hypothetical protein
MDFTIVNHGTLFTFTPRSDAARAFAREALADAQWFGGAVVVEHRYAWDLAQRLQAEGWSVE